MVRSYQQQERRTCYHIDFHIFVAVRKRVDGRLEHLGIQQKGRDIPEQDPGLWEVWNAPQVVLDELFSFCSCHVGGIEDGVRCKLSSWARSWWRNARPGSTTLQYSTRQHIDTEQGCYKQADWLVIQVAMLVLFMTLLAVDNRTCMRHAMGNLLISGSGPAFLVGMYLFILSCVLLSHFNTALIFVAHTQGC